MEAVSRVLKESETRGWSLEPLLSTGMGDLDLFAKSLLPECIFIYKAIPEYPETHALFLHWDSPNVEGKMCIIAFR